MTFDYCKLKPLAPFHLGERQAWLEGSSVFIHSDLLFSGICHCYALLYPQKDFEDFISKIINSNVLKISSAFPCWGDKYYWPIPKNQIPEDKQAYKIKFIEQDGFEKLLAGEKIENLMKQGASIIPRAQKPRTPWTLNNVPRISLNRLNNHPLENGGFFHSGRVTYEKTAGLFFIYKVGDPVIEKRFKASLRLLVEQGIGGDRSVGNGIMKIEQLSRLQLNVPQNANGEVLIALYHPKENELPSMKDGFYELLERKGYIYSPYGQSLRRRTVRMFTEGSVFPVSAPQRAGQLQSVKPAIFKKHDIYRYGLFWGLPCRKEVVLG